MADTQVVKKEAQTPATRSDTRAQDREVMLVPDVNIVEDNEGVRLVADMPGADAAAINVAVENNVLTIEGQGRVEAPAGYELVGQEFVVGKYRRDFTLSETLDTAGIKARVRHGVLELSIPKREEVKTRKIKIES